MHARPLHALTEFVSLDIRTTHTFSYTKSFLYTQLCEIVPLKPTHGLHTVNPGRRTTYRSRSLGGMEPAKGAEVQRPGGGAPATLATADALEDIKHVLMNVDRPCKMGISFWPSMSFKADRPPQARARLPAAARLLRLGDPWLTGPPASGTAGGGGSGAAAASAPEQAAAGGGGAESIAEVTVSPGGAAPKAPAAAAGGAGGAAGAAGSGAALRARAAAALAAGRRLLYVDFTKDPPDEFQVGARFMCGLPFPFISIRTTRLAGVVDADTGEVTLEFISEFLAQARRAAGGGHLASGNKDPTVLQVGCDLTTESTEVLGKMLTGERLAGGRCTLIAHALVPKTKSWFANVILWLPTAARAVLPMRLEFLPAGHPAAAAAAGEVAAAAAGGGGTGGGGRAGDDVEAPASAPAPA
ncbi:MAG: hypothetical protein J3K34DRAFT_527203 [Monoraphidium minutum]|nr:MAG: hypothetical protein J3K34DRAFT_527203 [Monoraphidium minutum]